MRFPALDTERAGGHGDEVLRFGDQALTRGELRGAALAIADRLEPGWRVAVPVQADLHTAVAVVGALLAGACVVPVNASAGPAELAHQVSDSEPHLVAVAADRVLPGPLAALPRLDVDLAERADGPLPDAGDPERPALVIYTSGTTGPPKGAVLPWRAVAADLDALARVWSWTSADVLVHALPLYHVHGLVLGVLGPLRVGGRLHHLVRFSPEGVAGAVRAGGTIVFGVPTMYSRLATAAEADGDVATALRDARLLVSGSAGLPGAVRRRMLAATGQWVHERYGMTETMIVTASPAAGPRPQGAVGWALPGVEVRVVDDDGHDVPHDGETMGEVWMRGDTVFLGYRNRPDATAELIPDGWAHSGDMAVWHADRSLSIVGRRSTDIIKSGGFKIGAGEIESALLELDSVAEVAVTGEPDDDLGERVVAWVVAAPGAAPNADELCDHVATTLSRHKRPRVVRFVDALPRNAMGKVTKTKLTAPDAGP